VTELTHSRTKREPVLINSSVHTNKISDMSLGKNRRAGRLLGAEPELSPQNLLKNHKDKAYCPQMNAKIREFFVCAPAAHCTL